MIVLTQWQMESGRDGIYTPSVSNGSAQALPMTEEEKQDAAKRAKDRKVGFRVEVVPPRRTRKRAS